MLIFIDVDGTLYDGHQVPNSAWHAVDRARALGHQLVICTGRSSAGVAFDRFAQRLNPDGPHIFDGGATIRWADGRVERAAIVPPSAIAAVVAIAREVPESTLEIYTAQGGFHGYEHQGPIAEHGRLLGLEPTFWDGECTDVVRAQLLTTRAAWPQLRPVVKAIEGVEVHLGTSPGMPAHLFVGLTQAGVSKLSAAAHVAGIFGASLAQCAMIGDGDNDAEIIGGVGFGVAMGDATPKVKRLARQVVASVRQDGLAEALELISAAA